MLHVASLPNPMEVLVYFLKNVAATLGLEFPPTKCCRAGCEGSEGRWTSLFGQFLFAQLCDFAVLELSWLLLLHASASVQHAARSSNATAML